MLSCSSNGRGTAASIFAVQHLIPRILGIDGGTELGQAATPSADDKLKQWAGDRRVVWPGSGPHGFSEEHPGTLFNGAGLSFLG